MKLILSIDPVRFPLTGIGRYTWELARQLQHHPQLTELRFFCGRSFASDLPVAREQAGSTHALKRWVQQNPWASEAYRRLMPRLKARALKGHEDALFHGPNFFLPPFAGKRVATFHDLSPFTWPQCNTPQRIRYLQKELLNTIQCADALITDSEFVRRELADYFSWPLERIHVVPLASGAGFRPHSAAALMPLLKQYDLAPGGYALFVGTIEPRKNIVALLDAYAMLPLDLRQRWPLILAGYQGWCSEAIYRRIHLAQQQGWARYLGYVPAEHLPGLFAGARLFAFPSLYEGFGLPVLEAMASGVPVVCSDSSSLPELVGKAALCSPAEDISALHQNLRRGLEDEDWRAQAISAGMQNADTYSWSRCADETIAVYRRVLGSG
jgi:alpha-1,3-rhamnosyl/mannosyltransferase